MSEQGAGAPHKAARMVRPAVGLLPLVVAGVVPRLAWREVGQNPVPAEIKASGTIEATLVSLAFEFGGRLAGLQVQEGSTVARGMVSSITGLSGKRGTQRPGCRCQMRIDRETPVFCVLTARLTSFNLGTIM